MIDPLRELADEIADSARYTKPESCAGCPLYGAGRGFVPDELPHGATTEVLFIGQNPGAVEEIQGRPFVGPTGEMFRKRYVKGTLAGVKVGYGNTIRCRLTYGDGARTDKLPSRESAEWTGACGACAQYTRATLDACPSALIVHMGEYAQPSDLGPLLHMRGSLRQPAFSQPTFSMLHPAALFPNRSPELRDIFQADMQRLARIVTMRRAGQPLPGAGTFPIPAVVELKTPAELTRWWGACKRIALDLETDALGMVDIVGLAKSATEACVLHPEDRSVLDAFVALCGQQGVELIVHFGEGLEIAWLHQLFDARPLPVVHDTHKLYHAFDPEYAHGDDDGGGSGALAFLQSLFTWRPYHKHLLGNAAKTGDSTLKRAYCQLDVLVTWEIFDVLSRSMARIAPAALGAYERHALPLLPIMARMTARGWRVDMAAWDARRADLKAQVQTTADTAIAQWGPGIAPKSKGARLPIGMEAVKDTLAAAGIKLPTKRREGGRVSPVLDREARQKLIAQGVPGIEALGDYWAVQDTLSDFYGEKLRKGRIHADCSGYLVSWRWRVTNPNLAQYPKQERTPFIADPGQALFEADTEAGEWRWFGGESGDTVLLGELAAYDQAHDPLLHPHVLNTALLFDVPVATAAEWKEGSDPALLAKYTFSKNYAYRLIYSYKGGQESLRGPAAKAGLAFKRRLFEEFDARLLAKYAVAREWREAWVAKALRDRVVVCREWGYQRRLHGQDDGHLANVALNFPMQAGIAGLVNQTIIDVERATGCIPLVNMHDGLVYQLLTDGLVGGDVPFERVARLVQQGLQRPLSTLGGLVIPCALKAGQSWGRLKAWRPGDTIPVPCV